MTKKDIAKLLHTTSNVSATKWEIISFFNSSYFNPNEEHEGNIIEDFLNFNGNLERDLEESRQHYENCVKYFEEQYKIQNTEEKQKKIAKLLNKKK